MMRPVFWWMRTRTPTESLQFSARQTTYHRDINYWRQILISGRYHWPPASINLALPFGKRFVLGPKTLYVCFDGLRIGHAHGLDQYF